MSQPARLTATLDCAPILTHCNPANHGPQPVNSPFGRKGRPAPTALPDDDYATLVNSPLPPGSSVFQTAQWHRLRLLLLLMGDAGLRAGEAAGLLTTDAYYNSGPVRSILIRAEISKSHRSRTIPVSTALQEALSQYDLSHTPRLSAGEPGPLLHASHRHVRLSTRTIQRAINIASLAILGHMIHPHILRHTFGTRLSKVTELKTVQELLGHVDLRSTQIYIHTTYEDKLAAINAMGKPRSRRDQ